MVSVLVSAARAVAGRYAEWRRREQAYAELSALDDRALSDIGVSRADIPFLVKGRTLVGESTGSAVAPANGNHRLAA